MLRPIIPLKLLNDSQRQSYQPLLSPAGEDTAGSKSVSEEPVTARHRHTLLKDHLMVQGTTAGAVIPLNRKKRVIPSDLGLDIPETEVSRFEDLEEQSISMDGSPRFNIRIEEGRFVATATDSVEEHKPPNATDILPNLAAGPHDDMYRYKLSDKPLKLLLRKLGNFLARYVLELKNSSRFQYDLARLPVNYVLYGHKHTAHLKQTTKEHLESDSRTHETLHLPGQKKRSKPAFERNDPYLFSVDEEGNVFKFRSTYEFLPHLYWLVIGDDNYKCECIYCAPDTTDQKESPFQRIEYVLQKRGIDATGLKHLAGAAKADLEILDPLDES